ncbi:MAG: protein CoxF [Hyphomicrobiaceae bacterium]|nr:protein CoxF [Hyphomicrobiaceae bacterium]MCC0007484.1 protein CoxF [Hyphomicrobiaceae bacterium]
MAERENKPLAAAPEEMSEEAKRRQRMRSWAIAGVLLFLVIAFYAATIVRLGGNVMNRPL